MKHLLKKERGFTLVEMIVAVGLFLICVSIATGAVSILIDSSRRVQTNKNVLDNFNLAIEEMTRFIRYGKNYHCGNTGTYSVPQDCINGSDFLAVQFKAYTYIFKKVGSTLVLDDQDTFDKNLSSEDVVITNLTFYTYGTTSGVGDTIQPYVIIKIAGYIKSGANSQINFDLQTTASQRDVDI